MPRSKTKTKKMKTRLRTKWWHEFEWKECGSSVDTINTGKSRVRTNVRN